MTNNAVAGEKYRVISDSYNVFNSGDIVVALENDSTPICVYADEFVDGEFNMDDYEVYGVLGSDELEVIE